MRFLACLQIGMTCFEVTQHDCVQGTGSIKALMLSRKHCNDSTAAPWQSTDLPILLSRVVATSPAAAAGAAAVAVLARTRKQAPTRLLLLCVGPCLQT